MTSAAATGLNFARLEAAIGHTGRLVGIDVSPHVLARARQRTERHGWANVELVLAAAEDAELPTSRADPALICAVHDVDARDPRSPTFAGTCAKAPASSPPDRNGCRDGSPEASR